MTDNAQPPQQQITIQRIYLKDASLETPLGPAIFTGKWSPKIQLDVNTRGEKLADDVHEVVLSLTVTATQDDKTGFLVEVQQAGIFGIKGLNHDQLRHVMSTFCPDILFPYAREAIDSLVIKASFPALMLAPMNFDALFRQAMQQQAEKEKNTQPTH